MKELKYIIQDPVGIHARPAGQLVSLAKTFLSTIVITKGEKTVNATRLMALMGMGIKSGDTITITVDGEDEDLAAEKLEAFLEENL